MAKIITTTEGGMIFTNEKKIQKIKLFEILANQKIKYEHTTLGTKNDR